MPRLLEQRRSFEKKVLVSFISALTIVAIVTVANWGLTLASMGTVQAVAKTQQIVNAISQVSTETLQIELNTQNYRITGEAKLLAERNKQIEAREKTMRSLRELLIGDTDQLERWQQLRAVLDQRISIAQQIS